MNSRTKAIVKLVATMLLVALVTVLAKKTLYQVSAFNFVWLQMFFAILSMAIYIFGIQRERIPRNIEAKAWLIVILMGVCNFTIVKTLFTLSLEILPVTTHAYLINFVGITTMLLSVLFLGERPRKLQILGALVALFGIHVYFWISPGEEQIWGIWLSVLTVFFLAITNILIRFLHLRYPGAIPPNIIAFVAVLSGGIPLILYGLQFVFELDSISMNNWIVIAANGVVAISITMSVFNYAMQHLRAYEASILASTGLIFTAGFSIPILAESVGLNELFGILLLLLGISLVQIKRTSSSTNSN